MKIKLLFWVLESIIEIMLTLYHEFWHWIMGIPYWIINYTTRPKLQIDRIPYIELTENKDGFVTYSVSMSIGYSYDPSKMKVWMRKSITLGPAIGFIVLIIILPWQALPLLIIYNSPLWLSAGDIYKLNSKTGL